MVDMIWINLVDGGCETGGLDELLQMLGCEVADTNSSQYAAASVMQLDHRLPCFDALPPIVRTVGVHTLHCWPVDQVQVDV